MVKFDANIMLSDDSSEDEYEDRQQPESGSYNDARTSMARFHGAKFQTRSGVLRSPCHCFACVFLCCDAYGSLLLC